VYLIVIQYKDITDDCFAGGNVWENRWSENKLLFSLYVELHQKKFTQHLH
jgi:hypothetical protein